MTDRFIRIAIDGPGGAGKSTIAKLLAKELGVDYIDTGAMYRAIALKFIRAGFVPEKLSGDNDEDMKEDISSVLTDTIVENKGGRTYLDSADVSDDIRSSTVSQMASIISTILAVREKLVDLQRKIADNRSVVMDGRDIGTNVMKDAEYKFFLTATSEIRAKRRYDEMVEAGKNVNYDDILSDMKQRDLRDTNRALNPLRRAEDAIEIDSSHMTILDVVNMMIEEIRKNGNS